MRMQRWTWVVSACLLAFGAGIASMAWFGPPSEPRDGASPPPSGLSVIEPATEWVRIYLDDALRQYTVVDAVRPEWVGLTASQFAELHPDWRLLSFSADRIVFEIVCDEYPAGGFLRLEGATVSIYDGDPQGCQRLRESLDLDTSRLTEFQRRELSAGVLFMDEEELDLILDGVYGP